MKESKILKVLSSIPVILISLYFIPFLGICLIILRYLIVDNKKRISTPIYIIGVGILILIPKGLNLILNMVKVDLAIIPSLKDAINAELYNVNFINYSKRLICVGVVFLIISLGLKSILNKIGEMFNKYITESVNKDYEISKKNDLEMKIKQEKAKNTNYVKCPYCGSDNLLSEKNGFCQYCRRGLENKKFK